MTAISLKNKALLILERLMSTYPNAHIELDYNPKDPWQLLVVVALSAQTTDKKVNQISPALFERFKSVHDFAHASPQEVEPYLKTIGLYRNKARHLVLAAQKIIQDFNGHIPKERIKLESIPGVGKKTAAVIISNAFGEPAIAVDTHVSRLAQRLGLTKEIQPDKIELALTKLFPKNFWLKAHHALIFHGRRICFARKPHCSLCPLADLCPKIGVVQSN
ncbi:MAG: endonuclease III [Myxococcales bacterium]|nr:endonuclease III [Myxococcales bacterium]USN51425.1 MAG: endonuclease III [Myxococcales bacterium]